MVLRDDLCSLAYLHRTATWMLVSFVPALALRGGCGCTGCGLMLAMVHTRKQDSEREREKRQKNREKSKGRVAAGWWRAIQSRCKGNRTRYTRRKETKERKKEKQSGPGKKKKNLKFCGKNSQFWSKKKRKRKRMESIESIEAAIVHYFNPSITSLDQVPTRAWPMVYLRVRLHLARPLALSRSVPLYLSLSPRVH